MIALVTTMATTLLLDHVDHNHSSESLGIFLLPSAHAFIVATTTTRTTITTTFPWQSQSTWTRQSKPRRLNMDHMFHHHNKYQGRILHHRMSMESSTDNQNIDDNNNNNMMYEEGSWSISEDWSARSQSENRPMQSQDIFHQDILTRAAHVMQHKQQQTWNPDHKLQEQETWMNTMLEEIHPMNNKEEQYYYDDGDDDKIRRGNDGRSFGVKGGGRDAVGGTVHGNDEKYHQDNQHEVIMEQEISQLIRCNQDPTQFLIQQGRVIPPLTEQEAHHVRQLVQIQYDTSSDKNSRMPTTTTVVVTPFFQDSIKTIFAQHALTTKSMTTKRRRTTTTSPSSFATETANTPNATVMDARSIATWLQKSLSIPSTRCGPYDPRVQHVVRKFGKYGHGYLELEDFHALYLQAVIGSNGKHNPFLVDMKKNGMGGNSKSNKNNNNPTGNATTSSILHEEEDYYHWLHLTRSEEIDQVWNDLERHGIVPPSQIEWEEKVQALEQELALNTNNSTNAFFQQQHHHQQQLDDDLLFHDECEIVEESQAGGGGRDRLYGDAWTQDDTTGGWTFTGKSSHEQVEVCSGATTRKSDPTKKNVKNKNNNNNKKKEIPVRFQDGDFVYIDEESCIGCTQCAATAPSSFRMIESTGRARTYVQDTSPAVSAAVATCPVNCMHYVGYERLVELERARDQNEFYGAEEQHHRHFGLRHQQPRQNQHHARTNNNMSKKKNKQGASTSSATQWISHTPMHVSRMASTDANHKQSIYHYIRNQCYKSSACPQKGCYDCPMYASNPESNPHLAKRRKAATHARAQHFIQTGAAQVFRRTAEL